MSAFSSTIGIIGAGAWGTALAQTQAAAGRDVLLWAREPEVVTAINQKHENTVFLPGVPLHAAIRATGDLNEAAEHDVILLVTPAQHIRSTLERIRDVLKQGASIVICAKGIELGSGKILSAIAEEAAPGVPVAVLTGPTFASEIARGLPCAVTIAARTVDQARGLCSKLASRTMRPYASDDLIGVQIGSAVKNVIAIASGMVAGKGLGESARAALMTRGLTEMARLSEAMGGHRETLMGMCGVGDLMLTASSQQSRNFSLGFQLGQGRTLEEILAERRAVTEGVHTAKAVMVMAKSKGVDMPVSAATNDCLEGRSSIEAAMASMMDRPLKTENL